MAANTVLEQMYRVQNGDHGVLFGSQFEEGFVGRGVQREIRLPDRAPNKEFGNFLLEQLRGPRGGPRKPDIVDFNDRAFYEIKPVRTFARDRHKTIQQHVSLYRMTDSIVREFNDRKRARTPPGRPLALETPWTIENSTWQPPACVDLPGLHGFYKLDTFSTDYTTDPNCRGIIVYRVWKRVRRREEEAQAAARVQVDDRDQKYDKLIPAPSALRRIIGRYDRDEPGHIVIVPNYLHDLMAKRNLIDLTASRTGPVPPGSRENKSTASPPSLFAKAGSLAARHPYLTTGAVLVVAASGVGLCVLAAGETSAVAGAGATLVEEGGAKIISLSARRLAAAGAAQVAKKAAAALIFFGVIKSVRGDEVTFSRIDAMKTVPLSAVAPYRSTYSALGSGMCIADSPEDFSSMDKDICVGDQVIFDSEAHAVVATMTAFPNNLSSSGE